MRPGPPWQDGGTPGLHQEVQLPMRLARYIRSGKQRVPGIGIRLLQMVGRDSSRPRLAVGPTADYMLFEVEA